MPFVVGFGSAVRALAGAVGLTVVPPKAKDDGGVGRESNRIWMQFKFKLFTFLLLSKYRILGELILCEGGSGEGEGRKIYI